jgi:hypothetical protein
VGVELGSLGLKVLQVSGSPDAVLGLGVMYNTAGELRREMETNRVGMDDLGKTVVAGRRRGEVKRLGLNVRGPGGAPLKVLAGQRTVGVLTGLDGVSN